MLSFSLPAPGLPVTYFLCIPREPRIESPHTCLNMLVEHVVWIFREIMNKLKSSVSGI